MEYIFIDGRTTLTVQDEVLLERVHDSISNLAGKLRQGQVTLSEIKGRLINYEIFRKSKLDINTDSLLK